MTQKHIVVSIVVPIYQYQPSPTIHYTYNEKLMEGLRCCEIFESIQTYTILVWSVGASYRNCHHHPWLKSWGVAMVRHEGFQSQPCTTIHYTYNETLEGLRCCELPESVQNHSMLASKVECSQANCNPNHDSKTHCDVHFRCHIAILTFSNHLLYL